MPIRTKYYVLAFVFASAILLGCSSADKTTENTAESAFTKAMEQFKKENYIEAKASFDVIKLQYPASQYADDAQYYYAESCFKTKEFVMASYHYNMLRRIYPGSEYAKRAMYSSAMCYNELSPTYDRDQEYTTKGIQTFTEYQTYYPKDSLIHSCDSMITFLRDKLGHKEFANAELYRILYAPNSALIYYNSVISDYDDTKYYEPSMLGKIEVLIWMKKYDMAQSAIDAYKTKFPNGPNIANVKAIEQGLPKKQS